MIYETSKPAPVLGRSTSQYANYRFRAVVDWISLKIVMQHPTNFDTVRKRTAPKSDVLHRHYVGLNSGDVAGAMRRIQEALTGLMQEAHQGV